MTIEEEERINQIEQFASQCYEDGERYSAFISGAIWADDNPAQDVVNLNDVWHDASEEPRYNELMLGIDSDGVSIYKWCGQGDSWNDFCCINELVKWAYISDLLPKGGER